MVKKQRQKHSKERQETLRQFLVDWIIENAQPFSVVLSPSFRHFISELDPAFVMPCPETIRSMIHIAFNYSFPQLKNILNKESTSVSCTMDLWTARNRQGYLGITCSFINSKFQLCEFTLSISYVRYPHTAENIVETLEQVLNEWEIRNKVFYITTDNGSNVKKTILDLEDVNWLKCTAHTLQLVVGKGMKPAEILIARAKRLIDFFMRPKQSECLEIIQQKFSELLNEYMSDDELENDDKEELDVSYLLIYNNFFILL